MLRASFQLPSNSTAFQRSIRGYKSLEKRISFKYSCCIKSRAIRTLNIKLLHGTSASLHPCRETSNDVRRLLEETDETRGGAFNILSIALLSASMASLIAAPNAKASQPAKQTSETIQMWQNPGPLDLANYRVMQAFTLPTYGKMLAIMAVGVPLVMLGAFAYQRTSGAKWTTSIRKTYYVLNNVPGASIEEDTPGANLVLNLVHLVSLFTFAILVGVFAEDIAGRVEAMKAGNFPLPESGHTVLLGWNSRQSVIMLRQILAAQAQRGSTSLHTPIVILSESNKTEVDEVLVSEFGDLVGQKIMTRQGSPTAPLDLARTAAARARAVVWMVPEQNGEEFSDTVDITTSLNATLASLNSIRSHDSLPQRVIVYEGEHDLSSWSSGPSSRLVTKRLQENKSTVTALTSFHDLHAMMVQSAMQPGLSRVFREAFQHNVEGVEFYSRFYPEAAGRLFSDVRKAFKNATLVGTVDRETGVTRLNPAENYVIKPNDVLALIAESDAVLEPSLPKNSQAELNNASKEGADETPKRDRTLLQPGKATQEPVQVLVLSHERDVGNLAERLAEFAPEGSHVTLVLPGPPISTHNKLDGAQIRQVNFHVLQGNLSSASLFQRAGVTTADSIILYAPSAKCGWHPADADNQMIEMVLKLQGIVDDENRRIQERADEPPSIQEESQADTASQSDQNSNDGFNGKRDKPLHVVCCVSSEHTVDVLVNLTKAFNASFTPTGLRNSAASPSSPSSPLLPSSSSSAGRAMTLDAILYEKLMGGILTQVASDPLLGGVFQSLFDEEGPEVHIKQPEVFGVPTSIQMSWSQVQDIVRAKKAIAIGYIDSNGKSILGLGTNANVSLDKGGRLVVIDDY